MIGPRRWLKAFGLQPTALTGTRLSVPFPCSGHRAKGNHMRTLVPPPPSLHCDLCRSELRLKRIDPGGPSLEWDFEIFVCIKCGHEHSFRVSHDRYAAHSRSDKPPPKLASQPGKLQ